MIFTHALGGRACLLAAVFLISSRLHAAGFALIDHSVTAMGTAYAGASAIAADPSTIYFNPAGMTRLSGTQAAAGGHLIVPSTKFSDNGSTFVNTLPLGGGNGGDAGGPALVPHMSITHQLDDRTWLGLTINSPFGTSTEYDDGWVGRYHALESSLLTVNINPSLAYKLNDMVSIGVGVSAMYADAKLTNAVDWGLIAGGAGAAGTLDGEAKLTGDAWGFGYNLGLLIEPNPGTRIGIQYRSEVEQRVKGDLRYSGRPGALAPFFPNADLTSTIDLPATASLSIYHEFRPDWAILFDYTWTGWSSVPELRFVFDSVQADGVTTLAWEDSSRVSLGAIHRPAGSLWEYRGGIAWDQSPVPDPQNRTPRLPDEDKFWFALGAGYKYSERLSFDIGYAYLIVQEAEIAKTATGEDLTRGALNGSYDADVHLLSAQVVYRL